MELLKGKIALITGASRGQGAEEARLFAQHGATVVLTDVEDGGGEALARELSGSAMYVHHDVTDQASWDELMAIVGAQHHRVDVLVNNAGITRMAPFTETDVDDLDLLYRVNQRGVFLGMKAVVDLMRAAGGGSIINIGSGASSKVTPNTLAYASTKWAVIGMTKNAALELAAFNIRVNAILPGLIDTPMLEADTAERIEAFTAMTPLGRLGTAKDVAKTALFLASDESSFVTAGSFPVDGGLVL
jgi:3alpha(or 20beta)-hydroxysteroid dehydrogenase